MTKIVLYSLLVVAIMTSCSARNEDLDLETTTPIVKYDLKIESNKTEGNIFEPFVLKMTSKMDNTDLINYMRKNFDSIVLRISDTEGSRKIFEKKDENNISYDLFWSHNFYLPGKYQLKMYGYKNSKVLFEDIKDVQVSNVNDFLNVNWNNFNLDNYATGFVTSSELNSLALTNGYENNVPYVTVTNFWENVNYNDAGIKDLNYFTSYLTKLYGPPLYSSANNPDIIQIYSDNFSKKLLNDKPVLIWVTEKNKIALINRFTKKPPVKDDGYKVIAEAK